MEGPTDTLSPFPTKTPFFPLFSVALYHLLSAYFKQKLNEEFLGKFFASMPSSKEEGAYPDILLARF